MSAVNASPEAGPVTALSRVEAPGFLRRMMRQPIAVVCIAYLIVLVAVAIVAPIVLPDVAQENAGDLLGTRQGPSAEHLLGTDSLGRDVLQRLLVGSRVTLVGVVEALAVTLALGLPLGLAAGYYGGWIDRVVSWLADLTFSMPAIVIVLVVLAVFPQNMAAAMVAFGVIAAPGLMRVVRSATLPIREELYIAAARVSGLSRRYIMWRHVLPRIAGAVIVQASLLAAVALLVQTGLAFLGLVVAPPAPSWGGMVAEGAEAIVLQPWLIWPPGMAIVVTILALGVLGDAISDASTEGWSSSRSGARRRRRSVPRMPERSPATPSLALPSASGALLAVEGLRVVLDAPAGEVAVVEDVSFDVEEGETLGIVGESGCGKTMTAMSILGLLPPGAAIAEGSIRFDGRQLVGLAEQKLRQVRGKEVALISQEPMVSLNPAFRVGWQLTEVVRRHHGGSAHAARRQAVELLEQVRLPNPELVARRYPHELSGGMAQRVAIARALAGEPRLLIADEPTTALDVTVQAEILELLRQIQRERRMAILLVTHDWGVVADLCDRAIVMYAGQVVERAPMAPLFHGPLHQYTSALLAANPHHAPEARTLPTIPGTVPQPGEWPAGCHFHPRCGFATDACRERRIPLDHPAPERETRCIHVDELAAAR